MAVNFAPAPEVNPLALMLAMKAKQSGASDQEAILQKMFIDKVSQGIGDTSPVQHWTQGAARMANGLISGLMAKRLIDGDKANSAAVGRELFGGGGGAAPAPAAAPVVPQQPASIGPPMSEFSPANPAESGIAPAPPPPQPMTEAPPKPAAEMAQPVKTASAETGMEALAKAMASMPSGERPQPPAGGNDIVRAARQAVEPPPLPRPRPAALGAPQAAPAPQVMASDGMPAPRPPGTIPSPFGVNIPVRTSSTLPKGLSERANTTLGPLVQALAKANLPVNITSAYRDPSHNQKVGGAKGSQHMSGNAIDMSLRGMSEAQKQQAIAMVQSHPGVNGFGYYPKSESIHLDVRPGGRAAWGQNYSRSSVGKGWPEWMTKQTEAWRAGQPVQMAQQQPQGGGPVPMPRPRPPGAPQDQPQPQPSPEMAQRVQLASLGGMPSPDAPEAQNMRWNPADAGNYVARNLPDTPDTAQNYEMQNLQGAPQRMAQAQPNIEMLRVRPQYNDQPQQQAQRPMAQPAQQPQVPPEIMAKAQRLWGLGSRGQTAAQQLLAPYMKPTEYGFTTLPDGTVLRQDQRRGTVEPVYQGGAKPTYGVIGKDQYGNEQYGWIDPNTKKVTPGNVAPQQPQGDSAIPPAPPGVDPKKWRDVHSEAEAKNAAPPSREQIMQIRKELQDTPSYKNIAQAAPIYKTMLSAAGRDTRAADVNLVYGLAKIMDPGSVVREGEISIAQAIATFPQYLQAEALSQYQATGRLSPQVRQQIMEEAHSRMQSYEAMYDTDASMYRGIAGRNRMNQEDIVVPFGPFEPYKAPEAPKPGAAPATPQEKVINGKTYFQRGGAWFEK